MNLCQKIEYLKSVGIYAYSDSSLLSKKVDYDELFELNDACLALKKKLFPKLIFDFDSQKFVLFYPSPNCNEFGQQSFAFDELSFLKAFNKIDSFDDFFQNNFANDYVKLVFKVFSVNPTVLQQTQNVCRKNKKRKKNLEPKKSSTINFLFGVHNYKPNNSKNAREGKYDPLNDVLKAFDSNNVDYAADCIQKCFSSSFNESQFFRKWVELARQAVFNASRFYDLSFFKDFEFALVNILKISSLSPRQKKISFEKFKSAVDKLNSHVV